MKKPDKGDKSSEYMRCFAYEINARWIRLLQSIPDFSGIGDTIIDLIRERDAYLRAKAILTEYDRFPVFFRKKKELQSSIHLVRQRVDEFPGLCQKSIQHHLKILHNNSILQQRLFHLLLRGSKQSEIRIKTHENLLHRMNETREQLEKLAPVALTFGVDLQQNLTLFNRNVFQVNRYLCEDADITSFEAPDTTILPGL